MLRMESLTDDEFRSRTLTGEDAHEVCSRTTQAARIAGSDYKELERINAEFRSRYKPPVMPTNLFMPVERDLSEKLMTSRTVDWYGKSIGELRAERGVVVHAAPPGE